MVRKIIVLLLCAAYGYAQSGTPSDAGSTLTVGKNGSLGLETSTTFAADLNDGSTGLETKAGIELVLDLFPRADRGAPIPEGQGAAVRLQLKNAAFTWWNTYQTTGGNYEQDNFNSWTARPLILSFDSLTSDVVWKNFFLRVVGTQTVMRTNLVSLRSIFDDVIDADDRFYVFKNQALWIPQRYNIQAFPLLKGRLDRDLVDVDYRSAGSVSGVIAGGAEFDKFSFTLKAASKAKGRDNNDNAWLAGADVSVIPFENLKIDATGFAAVNYDADGAENPSTAGIALEYRLPFSDALILAPFAGFDFSYETTKDKTTWEAGGGALLYTRGVDTRLSYRILDYDDVLPTGFSWSAHINDESQFNALFSWFDPAGEDSLIPNFGGFLQFEIADILSKFGNSPDYAVLAQFEYAINGKFFPYLRGGYKPEITDATTRTGAFIITSAVGCYLKPINYFAIDCWYERNDKQETSGFTADNGLLSLSFTITM
ncbi:MAG: hypothetical protein LBG05_07300 [Treponema sp.]|jgi:hypothetical protein|nr:hypothetical protein [Treponema sp.]